MGTILISDLQQEHIDNIGRFGKKYETRVRLWQNSFSVPYDFDPVTTGDYVPGTGIYTFPNRQWIKRIIVVVSATRDCCKVEYEDENGGWINWETRSDIDTPASYDFEFDVPIFIKKLRFTEYNSADPSDLAFASTALVYTDLYADITDFIGNDILIENGFSKLDGNVKLPHIRMSLHNENGRWYKGNDGTVLDKYYTNKDGDQTAATINLISLKQGGIRATIEIKFYSDDWEDSDFMLLANFYVRDFNDSGLRGES
jgi:hypothetical protein